MAESSLIKAMNVDYSMDFVLSMLVWPASLMTFVTLGIKSYRKRQLLDALPLLLSQLNASFIWGCLACSVVGYYNWEINDRRIVRGKLFGFRRITITSFLS